MTGLAGRVLAGSDGKQVLGILRIPQRAPVGHRQANETILVTAQEHVETTSEAVVRGGSIVAPTVGVKTSSLTMVNIQTIDDPCLGEGGDGVHHQRCLVGNTACIGIGTVIACCSARHMGSVGVGSWSTVVGDDLATGEGTVALIDPAIENSDDLVFSVNPVAVDRRLIGQVGLHDPTGGVVAEGDIGGILDEQYSIQFYNPVQLIRSSDHGKFIMSSDPLHHANNGSGTPQTGYR